MPSTQDERLSLLAQAAEILHTGLEPRDLVRSILDLSRQLISADAYAVWRLDGQWDIVAEHHLSPGYSRSTPPTSDSLPLEPLVFEDVFAEPMLRPRYASYRAEGIRSMLCVPLRIRGEPSGTITFYYRQRHARDETEVRLATALASLAGSALTTAENHQAQIQLRAASERAQYRLAFLAEASAILASSNDYETTLRHVARLAVPRLADWCTVHLAEPDGNVRQVIAVHSDPEKTRWAEEVGARHGYRSDRPAGLANVIRTGRSELHAEITDETLVAAARDAGHLEALRRVGMRSAMLVPLQARGRVLGALGFISAESGVRYGDDDLRLAEDLAGRAALAIENAVLIRDFREALDALRRSEAELRSSEEQFRQMVVQSPLSVQILAPDGRTLEVNRAWEELWGAKLEDLRDYNMLADAQLAELGILPYIQRAFAGEAVAIPPVAYDRTRTLPGLDDGRPARWVRAYAYPVRDGHGAIRKVVLVHEDFTDRKHLEDQLRERVAALGKADRQKDEFVAMLAHELRNPLAPILSSSHLLREPGVSPDAQDRSLDIIDRQVRQMSRLLDDLLDVSRVSRGLAEIRREPLDLCFAVRAAVQVATPLVEARGHHLDIRLPEVPVPVLADPSRLEQIVTNLLNNAAKYTPAAGHLELAVEKTDDGWGVIRVTDDGEGIPADLLPRVFDLFVQGTRSSDRSAGGLGIGLTLVRDLVRMHGGSVEARSDGRGRGSQFVVRLPLFLEGEPAAPSRRIADAPGTEAPIRILVVDDNEDAAQSLGDLLRGWGHEVRIAGNGSDAIARCLEFEPRLVLLDLGLPGIDGYEVAARLQSAFPSSHRPSGLPRLIAVTGYGRQEDRARSAEAGFHGHLVKPVDPHTLRQVIADVTRASDSPRPPGVR